MENRDFSIEDIQHAHLEAEIQVSNISVQKIGRNYFAGAEFSFNCYSQIKTDEKTYLSHRFHKQIWGFDPLSEPLFLWKFKGRIKEKLF